MTFCHKLRFSNPISARHFSRRPLIFLIYKFCRIKVQVRNIRGLRFHVAKIMKLEKSLRQKLNSVLLYPVEIAQSLILLNTLNFKQVYMERGIKGLGICRVGPPYKLETGGKAPFFPFKEIKNNKKVLCPSPLKVIKP